MHRELVVELKDVTVRYRGSPKPALNKVNLTVREGEILLVTGPNASGKTTLARVLTGLIPGIYDAIVEGSVRVCGRDPVGNPDSVIGLVGYLSQEPSMQIMTPFVYEELALPLVLKGINDREIIKAKVNEISKLLKLSRILSKSTIELSGGEVVKTVIASSIISMPKLLVLDEPAAFLDKDALRSLIESLSILKKHGIAAMVMTHKPKDFLGIADRQIILMNGRIIYDGPPTPISASMKAYKAYMKWYPRRVNEDKVIEVFRASYAYPRKGFKLHEISLCVHRGELVLVIGPNGSGKTTLLKLLSGILKPSKGVVKVYGRTLYIPQDPRIFYTYETGAMELKARGIDIDKAIEILELLGVKNFINEPVFRLSYGTMRKISILIGLLGAYDAIMLDEPTAGVDQASLNAILDLISRSVNSGKAIIVSTNDDDLVNRLSKISSMVVELEYGKARVLRP